MLRKTLALLLVAGLLVGFTNLTVGAAFWQITKPVPGNNFATGSLDITTNPASALFNAGNLLPGDKVTAPLELVNSSKFPVIYAMTTNATNPDGKRLRDFLHLTIKIGVKDCSNKGFDASGKVLHQGPLGDAHFGDGNPSFNRGDRILAAGAKTTLCFRVDLPVNAENSIQNATTTAEFVFHIEQADP
jgi:hypothetical protein